MRNVQDTFETRKQSFISAFSNLHDCTFKQKIQHIYVLFLLRTFNIGTTTTAVVKKHD